MPIICEFQHGCKINNCLHLNMNCLHCASCCKSVVNVRYVGNVGNLGNLGKFIPRNGCILSLQEVLVPCDCQRDHDLTSL